MRFGMTWALLLALVAGVGGQTGDKAKSATRFGIELDSRQWPQNTPKEALGSVLKAIGEKQIDYLLAQLIDPGFVDQRVANYAAQLGSDVSAAEKTALAFNRLVKNIAANFQEDPTKMTELQRFYKDAEWAEKDNDAVAELKGLSARHVFMKRIAPDRWVMLDREK